MPSNNAGKASSGSPFRPPPAQIWNNMVDAGNAWAIDQLSNGVPNPTRPRATDIIKLQNTSGASRRLGEVLKIEGKAITTVSDEHIWLLGVEPTADCYFGILKRPMLDDEIDQVQVSGCCMALIDITNEDHTRADVVAGSYVLESSDSGPLEILYAPAGTGEKECVVRFGGGRRALQVILFTDLFAAVNTKRDPSIATARILRKKSDGDLTLSTDEITIVNRFQHISLDAGTYAKAEWIDGEWQLYAADCATGASSENV